MLKEEGRGERELSSPAPVTCSFNGLTATSGRQISGIDDPPFNPRHCPNYVAHVNISEHASVGRDISGRLLLNIAVTPTQFSSLSSRLATSGDTVTVSNYSLVTSMKDQGIKLQLDLQALAEPALAVTTQEEGAIRYLASFLGSGKFRIFVASPLWMRLYDETGRFFGGYPTPPESLRVAGKIIELGRHIANTNGSLDTRVRDAEVEAANLSRAFHLHESGKLPATIAEDMMVTERTVRAWLSGSLPPALTILQQRLSPPVFTLYLPRAPSITLAAFLGAYQAVDRFFHSRCAFELKFFDRAMAVQVANYVHSLGISRPNIINQSRRKGDSCFTLRIDSPPLRENLAKLLSNNNEIPWAVLGTTPEKEAYLRAYLCSAGIFQGGRLYLRSKNHPARIVHLALLMEDMGVPVEVSEPKLGITLSVAHPYGISQLLKRGLLPPSVAEKASHYLVGKKTWEHPCSAYDRFSTMRAANPQASPGVFADALDIPYRTLNQWINRGILPTLVRAREDLKDWRDLLKAPYPGVIPFLYRDHDVSISMATAIAKQIPLVSVEAALTKLLKYAKPINQYTAEEIIRTSRTLVRQ